MSLLTKDEFLNVYIKHYRYEESEDFNICVEWDYCRYKHNTGGFFDDSPMRSDTWIAYMNDVRYAEKLKALEQAISL